MLSWLKDSRGKDSDVVISSRIRLARNFEKYFYSTKIEQEQERELINSIKSKIEALNEEEKLTFINTIDLTNLEKRALIERHVISPFLMSKNNTAFVLSEDESKSIMINEEDHIRIQVLKSGMDLYSALEEANKIDDSVEKHFNYAFDEQYGYLTSCPSNVGTGMRASYMIHLPSLESAGKIKYITEAISKFGLTLRGIYGEGTKPEAAIYQISNQITLGYTEEEIIDNLEGVVNQVIEQERRARYGILKSRKIELEDIVFRSYGILSNARLLSTSEAMELLSDLKIGVESEVIKFDKSVFNIYELMIKIQPASMQKIIQRELTEEEIKIERANYIRKYLPSCIN